MANKQHQSTELDVYKTSRRPRVLLAACGSVAATKFPTLCHTFTEWADVVAVATPTALHFMSGLLLPGSVKLFTNNHEWSIWNKIGDKVLHNELRNWADILVIAPLSANTLAKIAGGLSDNLLTCIVRAWDYDKPVFVAPSMNTMMWRNSLTERHLMVLDELGVALIRPAGGESGIGAMAEPSAIFSTVRLFFEIRSRSTNSDEGVASSSGKGGVASTSGKSVA